MMERKIEIVKLDESLISNTAILVAGYLNSSEDGEAETAASSEQFGIVEQNLQRLLSSDAAHCYVAMYGEEYAGFVVLSWSFSVSKGLPVLRVEALYTAPKCRKQGVARSLLEHAVGIAGANGANRLQLETGDGNTPARTLYTNLGFEHMAGKGVYMLFL